MHDVWHSSCLLHQVFPVGRKTFFKRNEDNIDFFLVPYRKAHSDLMVRQGPQINNYFERKPVLLKPGTSVYTFTRSCMQKSERSLLETHPVLSGGGALRSFSDLLTFSDSPFLPCLWLSQHIRFIGSRDKACFMSLTRDVKESEVLRIIQLRQRVSSLHSKHADLPERTTERQLKRVHTYREFECHSSKQQEQHFSCSNLILLRSQ